MGRSVGSVKIDFTAGNGQLISVIEKNKAAIRDFSTHAITDVQAAGAAFRTLEGTLSIRAVEQFGTKFLGLGPIVQAAFPVVGALAFGNVIVDMTEKVSEFVTKMRTVGERLSGMFRDVAAPLRMTNDELRITNDRLDNDITKLEGKRQNTLKLALDEARKSADALADSLAKSLSTLYKLMKEEQVGYLQSFFTRHESTRDLVENQFGQSGHGGVNRQITDLAEKGASDIAKIKDPKQQEAARKDLDARLIEKYKANIADLEGQLKTAEETQATTAANIARREQIAKQTAQTALQTGKPMSGMGAPTVIDAIPKEQIEKVETLRLLLRYYGQQMEQVGQLEGENSKKQKKDILEIGKANLEAYKSVTDKIKELQAQLDGARLKMAAIGKPEAFQVAAKGAADALKEITALNKGLESRAMSVSTGDQAKIRSLALDNAMIEAESKWQEKTNQSRVATLNRVAALKLLTDAIGKGYEKTTEAAAQAKLLEHLGPVAFDSDFRAKHEAEIEAELEAQRKVARAEVSKQIGESIDKLETQMEIEKALVAVEDQGALAVARLTEAYKERDAYQQTKDADLVRRMRGQFEAGQGLADEKSARPLREKLAVTQAITDAQIRGSEAERKAANESQYSQLEKDKGKGTADAQRALDELENQQKIRGKALNSGGNFGDRLQENAKMIESLKEIKAYEGDTFDIELRLRELENERLHILADQALQVGTARAGVKAFFIEMQTEAKKASQIVYEALNSALDKVSDNISKLATGQKANWGKMFQDVGGEMVKSSTKSLLQSGIGALGKVFGVDTSGLVKPDGSKGNPIYVRNADGIGGSITGAIGKAAGGGGLFGGGDKGGGIFSLLGTGAGLATSLAFSKSQKQEGGFRQGFGHLLQGVGGLIIGSAFKNYFKSMIPSVSSSINYGPGDGDLYSQLEALSMFGGGRAAGGPTSPGGAYLVGENGPEILFSGSHGSVINNAESRRMMSGGGDTHQYFVDARGADQTAFDAKMVRVLEAVHNSAAATGVRATFERAKRVPGGG